MNCYVEIDGDSFHGTFKEERADCFVVQMAGSNGYKFVENRRNRSGKIKIPKTGVEHRFTAVRCLDPDTYSISFQK